MFDYRIMVDKIITLRPVSAEQDGLSSPGEKISLVVKVQLQEAEVLRGVVGLNHGHLLAGGLGDHGGVRT